MTFEVQIVQAKPRRYTSFIWDGTYDQGVEIALFFKTHFDQYRISIAEHSKFSKIVLINSQTLNRQIIRVGEQTVFDIIPDHIRDLGVVNPSFKGFEQPHFDILYEIIGEEGETNANN